MINGFLKVASVTPKLFLGDPHANAEEIFENVLRMEERGTKVLLFPELSLTGCTLGDLYLNKTLLEGAKSALFDLTEKSEGHDIFFVVGLPYMQKGKIYNVAAAIYNGTLLGVVPKTHIPEGQIRYFSSFENDDTMVFDLPGGCVNFGTKLLFSCLNLPELLIGIEISEDMEGLSPVSNLLAENGATLILNLFGREHTVGSSDQTKCLATAVSKRQHTVYMIANPGEGESTTDLIYASGNLIIENGKVLKETKPFSDNSCEAVVDLEKVLLEKARDPLFKSKQNGVLTLDFDMPLSASETQKNNKRPFIPEEPSKRDDRFSEILDIQASALARRLKHTHSNAVLGLSGGLDSTLALLVTVRAFDLLKKDRKEIFAVTMPGFGTTKRTKSNAEILSNELGTSFETVSIREAVTQHFKDIGHDIQVTDVTYENAQARERTQILMDIANKRGALVIGTGDLSELALGWATYNGDQMSMYGVNADIPKTLVRYLVDYIARTDENEKVKSVLLDILDTPVSPELLPPDENGKIAQCTEDTVGPYDLHDYFLYYFLRYGFNPQKIYRMALSSWGEEYDEATIKKWLYTFFRRFFMQQFKRSCMPDGPKVGTVALSPRGAWRMPSDAQAALWLKEIEEL